MDGDAVRCHLSLGTLSVNVIGGFIIGLLATFADELGRIGPDERLLLVVGVLGGFTTFSSFTLETWRLAENSELGRASLYVLASGSGNAALSGPISQARDRHSGRLRGRS
ncbi:MAG: fluoride efflux transporter FluC [Dehalococcoidia bacterium]